jgi:hypothetical protein
MPTRLPLRAIAHVLRLAVVVGGRMLQVRIPNRQRYQTSSRKVAVFSASALSALFNRISRPLLLFVHHPLQVLYRQPFTDLKNHLLFNEALTSQLFTCDSRTSSRRYPKDSGAPSCHNCPARLPLTSHANCAGICRPEMYSCRHRPSPPTFGVLRTITSPISFTAVSSTYSNSALRATLPERTAAVASVTA